MLRHVKYVYDWVKPTLPSACIISGRVKASARKITCGCDSCIRSMIQPQNWSDFVCGLSTRKIVTPLSAQNRSSRSDSAKMPAGSLSKLIG